MGLLRLNSGDVKGLKFLFWLSLLYGVMSLLVYFIVHMKLVVPLGIDAPLDKFSEARAIRHVRVLSEEIDGRQEGRPGIKEAASYIKAQLHLMKERGSSNIKVEIEESTVAGSFNMMFLGHSISCAYRNHSNVVMRISSVDSREADASVLLNGHYDSPLGSPGAADCGSCVASMLEIARHTIDSGWVPPRPIIFLFNGAEELFLLGAHGFMKTHRWNHTIGAFINIEASGSGGLDLVCQSGPGSWPSRVYAQSAVYPMAHSAAQDVFPIIPGDTDYRMFAEDIGNIPGLDIIFLLGGYFYHTSYDTVERLLPGSIQARGENLISVMKAFTNSPELRNAHERVSVENAITASDNARAIFFDYLSWFMVIYSKNEAAVLHSIPISIFILVPFISRVSSVGQLSDTATFCLLMKGMLFHATGIILATTVPVFFSILRLLFSSTAMPWFAHPYLAFFMFIPSSLIGLLIPWFVWRCFPSSPEIEAIKKTEEASSVETKFWGVFGSYALLTLIYHLAGLNGGFMYFLLSVSMLLGWISYRLSIKVYSQPSLRSTLCYLIPVIPSVLYAVYFGGFLVQFVIEKMGMMGSLPPPYGFFVPDIIVAAVIGVVTSFCVGPLLPICSHWLARSNILQFLVHFVIMALALSSQFFPYATEAPKRVIVQHTFRTADAGQFVDSSYEFSVVDSNSFPFLFKHAPEVAKELHLDPKFSFDARHYSPRETWMALFPVSYLFSGSLKFQAGNDEILRQYKDFPYLSAYKPNTISSGGSRRVHLELCFGSVEEVWVTVLNITGPLSSWSLVQNELSAPETMDGGPPSYICRFSGNAHENWTFWLEANSSDALRVEVAVLDQRLVDATRRLKGLFPAWVDVTAYSSFMSSYTF